MAHYVTTLDIPRSIEETFAFVSDFRNAPRWDPQSLAAYKVSDGPIGLGSKFLLIGSFLRQTLVLPYEIVTYEPPHTLALVGETRHMSYHDRISLAASGPAATRLTYDATLDLEGWLRHINVFFERLFPRYGNPIFQLVFQHVGDVATENIPEAVTGGTPPSSRDP